jgi:hypothetical protein
LIHLTITQALEMKLIRNPKKKIMNHFFRHSKMILVAALCSLWGFLPQQGWTQGDCTDCNVLVCDGSACDDGTPANGVQTSTSCSNCSSSGMSGTRACALVSIDLTGNPDFEPDGGCHLWFDTQEQGNFDIYFLTDPNCQVTDCSTPDFSVNSNGYALFNIPVSGMIDLIICKDGGAGRRNLTVTLECCDFYATCNLSPAVQTIEGCSVAALPPAYTSPSDVFSNITSSPCGDLVLTHSDQVSGTLCPNGISVTRTYVLFDDLNDDGELNDNEEFVTCVQNFRIVDTTGPVPPLPPADLTLECGDDIPPRPTLFAIDNCNGQIQGNSFSSTTRGDCEGRYTLTRRWVFTDHCGNTSQIFQTITVDDTTPPQITCPPYIAVECGESIGPANTGYATAWDLCDPNPSVSYFDMATEGDCALEQVIVRTWRATDDCGNTSSCSQTIRINPPPAAQFDSEPGDIEIGCNDPAPQPSSLHYSNGGAPYEAVLFRVNSGGPDLAAGSPPPWGQDQSLMNSPYLSNSGSNSTFSTISPITMDASVPPGTPEALFQTERFDTPGGTDMEYAFPGIMPGAEVTVTLYLAEIFGGADGPGNRIFDVALEGSVPSEFNDIDQWAIANALNGNNGGLNYGFVLSATVVVWDGILNVKFTGVSQNPAIKGIEISGELTNCIIEGDVVSTLTFFDDDCLGYWEEIWSFTDECDRNITASRIIDVVDNTPPTGTCPSGLTGLATLQDVPAPDPAGVAANFTDICGSVSATLINSFTAGTSCGGFNVYYTYQISDACGNATYCTVVHSGGNATPLTGNCSIGNLKLTCLADVPPPNPTAVAAGFTGNGPVTATLVNTISMGDNCSGFTVIYVYEVSDNCATIICEVVYQGIDMMRPEGVCPVGLSNLSCVDDIPDPDPAGVAANFTDNCGDVTAVLINTIDETDDCNSFSRTYVYEISDPCGHSTTCSVTHSGTTELELIGAAPVGLTGLTCINDAPGPDLAGVAAAYSDGCGGTITASLGGTYVTDLGCNGFQVMHTYMVMNECNAMVWVSVTHSGANCPGACDGNSSGGSGGSGSGGGTPPIRPLIAPDITIYPNPTHGEVILTIHDFEDERVTVTVFDILGRVVYLDKIDHFEALPVQLDLRSLSLADGAYLVNVRSSRHSLTKRLVLRGR